MLHINKFFVSVIFVVSFFALAIMHNSKSSKVQNDLSNCVIRFHVKANSDTIPDQNLKLKVKDNVVGYMNQHSSEFTSLEDAKQFIASHDKDLKKTLQCDLSLSMITVEINIKDVGGKKHFDPSDTRLLRTICSRNLQKHS